MRGSRGEMTYHSNSYHLLNRMTPKSSFLCWQTHDSDKPFFGQILNFFGQTIFRPKFGLQTLNFFGQTNLRPNFNFFSVEKCVKNNF